MNGTFQLTDEQKGQVRAILSAGCDRQTAVDYVGCSLGDLRRAMQHDSVFARDVRRGEATVELNHMRILHESAKEAKNWRISVWWLEQHAPERFAARGAGPTIARQLRAFNGVLVDILREEVRDTADRRRLMSRLNCVVENLDQMLRDSQMHLSEPFLAEEGQAPSANDFPSSGAQLTGSDVGCD